MGVKRTPEVVAVKARVMVAEKAFRENTSVLELLHNLVHPVLYLIEVCMVSCLRVGHSRRNAQVISKEKRVCCPTFLASLILDAFSSLQGWGMGAVYVEKRQVKGYLVLIDYIGVCLISGLSEYQLICNTRFDPYAIRHLLKKGIPFFRRFTCKSVVGVIAIVG